ncbi:unnamed protein product [Cylindrotheca closterium]|uniref:FCP1 homology domain-containing protein n=1 Tax=Cylindrotheca closterium TaxID=2856 RepID=A0AAD2FYN4_9STRA|nr:unnamed protein product [Cylindrotheca closterium]
MLLQSSLVRSLESSAVRRSSILRCQSTWVAPNNRSRNLSWKPRRPVVNGKSVAFHVNDLKPNNYSSKSKISTEATKATRRKKREYDSDMVVVLDLDECLIHSQFMQGPGARYAHQVRQTRGWKEEDPSSQVDTFEIFLPGGESARVHERPFLHDFLQAVSEKYETHLFTAAMEVYATPIIKRLDPHGTIFADCWYRDSCVMDPALGAYVKDLEFAWGGEQLKRTVLVDNNPLSFLANPENGILVSSFFTDPNDKTLLAVQDLLHNLDEEEDVRPVLDTRFGLRDSFQKLDTGGSFAGRQFQIDAQQEKEELEAAQEHDDEMMIRPVAAAGFSS